MKILVLFSMTFSIENLAHHWDPPKGWLDKHFNPVAYTYVICITLPANMISVAYFLSLMTLMYLFYT